MGQGHTLRLSLRSARSAAQPLAGFHILSRCCRYAMMRAGIVALTAIALAGLGTAGAEADERPTVAVRFSLDQPPFQAWLGDGRPEVERAVLEGIDGAGSADGYRSLVGLLQDRLTFLHFEESAASGAIPRLEVGLICVFRGDECSQVLWRWRLIHDGSPTKVPEHASWEYRKGTIFGVKVVQASRRPDLPDSLAGEILEDLDGWLKEGYQELVATLFSRIRIADSAFPARSGSSNFWYVESSQCALGLGSRTQFSIEVQVDGRPAPYECLTVLTEFGPRPRGRELDIETFVDPDADFQGEFRTRLNLTCIENHPRLGSDLTLESATARVTYFDPARTGVCPVNPEGGSR